MIKIFATEDTEATEGKTGQITLTLINTDFVCYFGFHHN